MAARLCGSSGKSDFMAVWILLNWLAAPYHTLGLLTSTSIRDSKKRVWGAVARYWPAIAHDERSARSRQACPCRDLPNSMDGRGGKRTKKGDLLLLGDAKESIGFSMVAGDFCEQLVRSDSNAGSETPFAANQVFHSLESSEMMTHFGSYFWEKNINCSP
jgi:hypothetical protein